MALQDPYCSWIGEECAASDRGSVQSSLFFKPKIYLKELKQYYLKFEVPDVLILPDLQFR